MIKDVRYIIKRVIIGVLIVLILSFIKTCEVKAINTDTILKVNGTQLTGRNKVYTSGNQNVTFQLEPVSGGTINNQRYQYGYMAICGSSSSYTDRYISTASSSQFKDIDIVNSTKGCTIPTTNAYATISRTIFISFRIPLTNYSCNSTGTECMWPGPGSITIYQPGSNEYALVSFGFSNSAYNFNSNVDVNVYINQSILNATTETNGKLDVTNGKLDSINGSINNSTSVIGGKVDQAGDKVSGKVDATNGKLDRQYDFMKDSNVNIDSLPSDNLNLGPISALVTLPVTALNNIINAFSGTCTAFDIGSLLGTNLSFPCIDIENYIGTFLWNTIDIIVTGIYIFGIRKHFVDLFYKLVSLKDIGLKGGF